MVDIRIAYDRIAHRNGAALRPALTAPDLRGELAKIADEVRALLLSTTGALGHQDLRDASGHYTRGGGKMLRPAVLLWSAEAVGGDPTPALPAAAAVELFHTWTLVHDDIIDRDTRRRGVDAVHERYRKVARERLGTDDAAQAEHFGATMGILAGDVQQGLAVRLMTSLRHQGVRPDLVLELVEDMEHNVVTTLVEGEYLDVLFAHLPLERIRRDDIENMLWKKTGALLAFAARAGAMIGLNTADSSAEPVRALEFFASTCGVAFQLQDDILGVTGDPARTGKPVGGDLREGKRTVILAHAWQEADPGERALLADTLGHSGASEAQVSEAVRVLIRRGGIEAARKRARQLVERGRRELLRLDPGRARDLLAAWADYTIARSS